MSFLNLPELRTKEDYDTYINDVITHQADPAHQSHLSDDMNKLQHISNIILNHFNSNDMEDKDPNLTSLKIKVSDISNENVLNLQNALIGKGYNVDYIDNSKYMIISN